MQNKLYLYVRLENMGYIKLKQVIFHYVNKGLPIPYLLAKKMSHTQGMKLLSCDSEWPENYYTRYVVAMEGGE